MVNNMENADEVMQVLDRFTRLKQKEIPKELDDYLHYVAKTGDTVFKWSNLKYLFREKLLNVIKNFHDTSPRVDEIPQYPNVDPFNYENMKSALLERLELFNAAPFTIQRLCELLIDPRKQYSRIDKFMRALEKNILVVSTIEPGRKRTESENGDSLDSVVNGDLSLDVNVDIDMENDNLFNIDQQNGNGHAVDERAEEVDVGAGGDSAKVSASEGDAAAKSAVDAVDNVMGDGDNERKISADSESPKGRARDEPTQAPNPKKAKLDLPDEKADDTAAEESKKSADPVADAETKEKDSAGEEPLKKADSKDADDNKEKVDVKETTCEKEQVAVEDSKKTEKKDSKEKEEEMKAVEKPATTEDNASASTTGDNETSSTATEKSDAVEKKAAVVESVASTAEAEEKIIEKQEIEKCEKEVVAETDKVDAEVVSTTTAPVANVTDTKAEPESPVTDAKIDSKADEAIPKEVEAVPAAAATEAKASVDQPETSEIAETPTATTDTEKKDAKKEELKEEQDKTSSKEEKEADSTTVQVADKKPETVAVEKVEASEATDKTDKSDIAEDKSEVGEDKKAVETSEAVIPDTAEAKEVVAEITATGTATATESVTSSTTPVDKEAVVVPVDTIAAPPPSLALNDQPMEEVPQEDVSPTAENEVVMAETISSSTAMTTEAMDTPVAEEPEESSGMEVDDTSPPIEEMDQ